ncbi:MAG TPA: RNase H family protein, partial [Candidatus Acidoferrum sp.]|nr:RNase H family protein [Candidatus Acidoferrum sp.]
MEIQIYTDGSATTNDKPGGYAWVMVVDGVKHSEGSGHLPLASNNDAELEAAIQGLRNARMSFGIPPDHFKEPIVFTLVSDSKLVLGWTNGSYAFRQEDKKEKYAQLQLLVN